MTVRFRTAGVWGAGEGVDLTPSQVDENFWTLQQAIAGLVGDLPDPVDISDITVVGNRLFVHLSDASVIGPLELPIASFRWRDAGWEPLTEFLFLDLFVTNGALYLSLQDHTTSTEFDENEMSEATTELPFPSPLYKKLIDGIGSEGGDTIGDVVNIETDGMTVDNFPDKAYIRVSSEGTETAEILLDLPAIDDVGKEWRFRQVGSAKITFNSWGPVTVVGKAGYVNSSNGQGAVIWVKLVEAEIISEEPAPIFEIWGDLEEAGTE